MLGCDLRLEKRPVISQIITIYKGPLHCWLGVGNIKIKTERHFIQYTCITLSWKTYKNWLYLHMPWGVKLFLLFLYFISTTGWFYVCCIRDVFILVFIDNLYFILQTTLLLCRTESQIWGFHTMTRLHSYLLFAEVVEIIFLYEAMFLFMCWFVGKTYKNWLYLHMPWGVKQYLILHIRWLTTNQHINKNIAS
jgi:hypothetical protein